MALSLRDSLIAHHVDVATDNPFQQRARLLQALWRETQRLPIGEHNGRPLGSRLAMPSAKDSLSNYLTDAIRDVVRHEVLDPAQRSDKLYGQPRIFNDLLSSQPLCFNLFGELRGDLALASRAFGVLTSHRVAQVTRIEFEHSPGRGNARYTGDRSAFDVFVEFRNAKGELGFVGIEVKYHEDLGDAVAPHRERYDELAREMDHFQPDRLERLRLKPLQQIWRDHLLMGSLLLDEAAGYRDGFFAFLYPRENRRCGDAVAAYEACLREGAGSFVPWTLEAVVEAVRGAGAGPWIDAFASRYLGVDEE